MPHLRIEYSDNLASTAEMQVLCVALVEELAATGLFPRGDIRVRAYPTPAYAIADHHSDNAFADLTLRIGHGRSAAEKRETGRRIMACAAGHLGRRLTEGHFALSLELTEIDSGASWTANAIDDRLGRLDPDRR